MAVRGGRGAWDAADAQLLRKLLTEMVAVPGQHIILRALPCFLQLEQHLLHLLSRAPLRSAQEMLKFYVSDMMTKIIGMLAAISHTALVYIEVASA